MFENGKIAKVPLSAYFTKTNRKRLTGAYSDKERLASAVYVENDDTDIVLRSSSGRILIIKSSDLLAKTSRNTQGVAVMKLRKGHRIVYAEVYNESMLRNPEKYRAKTIPASGRVPSADESGEQITFG